MKKSNKLIFIIAMLSAPNISFAGTMTGGATFPEQLIQEVTLIQSKVTQAQQLVNMIQRYENMIQNMVTLPQSMINKVLQPIEQLYGLAEQAQSIGTEGENISSEFQQLNVSVDPQMAAQETQNYESITTGFNNAVNEALKAANLDPSNFTTEQKAMQQVANAMQDPNSRNAIMQASVGVGQAEVSDLTQLAQTTNSEATLQAMAAKSALLRKNADNQISDNQVQSAFGGGSLSATGDITPTQGLNGSAW